MSRFNPELKNFFKNRIFIILFAISFIILGIATYKDYGLTWDEYDVYTTGQQLYDHVLGKSTPFFSRDLSAFPRENILVLYNHSYGAISFGIAKNIFHSTSYETFHLINIMFSTIIFIAIFELLYSYYKKQSLAIIGVLFLLLVPRFIGDIPVNSRDISFSVFYFLSILAIYKLEKFKLTGLKIILLGLLFGVTQSLRIIGLTIYVIYLLNFIYAIFNNHLYKSKNFLKIVFIEITNLIAIILISLFYMIATSPYLGNNFIANFINMINFSKQIVSNDLTLFNGKLTSITQLPLLYLPTWLLITTPVFLIILLIISLFFIKRFIKIKIYFLLVAALIINLLAYFILKPAILDGLRHFLFLLPIISTLAAIIIIESILSLKNKINKSRKVFMISLLIFVSFNIALVIVQYVNLYPYQYTYFNELIGYLPGAHKKFETDYWGASFKNGIEWLKLNEINSSKQYNILTCGHPFQTTYYFSDNMHRVTKLNEADYYICYDRYNQNLKVDQSTLIHTISREGIPLMYIYKLKPNI